MTTNFIPQISIIKISDLLDRASVNSHVQRDVKPSAVAKLVDSFEHWLEESGYLSLPMFFAVYDEGGHNFILHDGQHRLEALNYLALAYAEEFTNIEVAVTVFPHGTPNKILKTHFNAVNCGLQVTKNLQAAFSNDWEDIASHFTPEELTLIETEVGKYNATAYNAADISKLVQTLGMGVITPLKTIFSISPEHLNRRTKSFREYAVFSSGFVNALLELPKYVKFSNISELLHAMNTVLASRPMTDWANNKPFPYFWTESKSGTCIASTGQAKKAWIAKFLEMFALDGFEHLIQIPQKLASVCEYLPSDSPIRLRQFIYNTKVEKASQLAAEKEAKALLKATAAQVSTSLAPKSKSKSKSKSKAKTEVVVEPPALIKDVEPETQIAI